MLEYINTGLLVIIFGYLNILSGRISHIEGYLDIKNKKNPKKGGDLDGG